MKTYITITILILAAFFGCSKEQQKIAEPQKPKAPLVKVEILKPSSISTSIKLTGTVEAKIVTTVVAPADGYIEKIHAYENEFVRKEKVMAIISSQERTSLVSQTKNKVDELTIKLAQTATDNIEYSQLVSDIAKAKKELEYADKLFLGVPVVAPFSGTVTQKFIETGSIVSAKQPMFTIVDFSSLIIKSSVSEDLFSRIKLGDKLTVQFNALPQRIFAATVTLKYQQIDPSTRTFPVELRLISGTKEITPGMMVELQLVTNKKEKTITVSNDVFIANQKGEKLVYVVIDTVAHQRIVTTGISNETVTEITSGVSAGEKIIVLGQELLKDGMKVTVQKSKEANKENGMKK